MRTYARMPLLSEREVPCSKLFADDGRVEGSGVPSETKMYILDPFGNHRPTSEPLLYLLKRPSFKPATAISTIKLDPSDRSTKIGQTKVAMDSLNETLTQQVKIASMLAYLESKN